MTASERIRAARQAQEARSTNPVETRKCKTCGGANTSAIYETCLPCIGSILNASKGWNCK